MDSSTQQRAHQILDKILGNVGYEYKITSSIEDGEIYFQIDSPEAGRLIGRRAQMVQAIQLVLNRILQRELGADAPRCVVDVENYRQRRSEELQKKAMDVAEEARQTGRSVRMQPMNAFDRRTVHRALASDEGVETASVPGKDSRWKSVVVTPLFEDREEEEEYDDYDDYSEAEEQDGDEQPLHNTL